MKIARHLLLEVLCATATLLASNSIAEAQSYYVVLSSSMSYDT